MSTFTLDTSGAIRLVPAKSDPDGPIIRWTDLDPFTQGYVEALLISGGAGRGWSKADRRDWPKKTARHVANGSSPPLPSDVAFSDLSPSALERIVRDCGERLSSRDCVENTQAGGRSFWTRRQAGDRIAQGFPALTVSLDDAGKVTLADRVRA